MGSRQHRTRASRARKVVEGILAVTARLSRFGIVVAWWP